MGGAGPRRVRCSGSPGRRYDPELAKEDDAEIVLQVNGKAARPHLRCRSARPRGRRAKQRRWPMPKVQPFIDGKQVVKIIVVPDKLVNIVVERISA